MVGVPADGADADLRFPLAGADDQLDYAFDFAAWLAPLDRIANATVLPDAALALGAMTFTRSPCDSAPWACRCVRCLRDRVLRRHAAGAREERLRDGDAAMIPRAWVPNPARFVPLFRYAGIGQHGRLPPPLPRRWPDKRANDVLDYGLDCRSWLAGARDTIETYTLAIDPSDMQTQLVVEIGGVLIAWLSGGTPGRNYAASWAITLRSGQRIRRPDRHFRIARTRLAGTVDAHARGTTE